MEKERGENVRNYWPDSIIEDTSKYEIKISDEAKECSSEFDKHETGLYLKIPKSNLYFIVIFSKNLPKAFNPQDSKAVHCLKIMKKDEGFKLDIEESQGGQLRKFKIISDQVFELKK